MSLAAQIEVNVRPGANDLNGGGFRRGGTGVDYSLQDSPHVTLDGATITAASSGVSATIVLTGYTVSANDVNNLFRLASGTNVTAGTYEIVSVNTGTNSWTLDRNATTGVAAAIVGRMGGAKTTWPGAMLVNLVNGNMINIQGGTTYVQTTTATIQENGAGGGNGIFNLLIEGYTTTPHDTGSAALSTATNSTDIADFTQSSGVQFKYLNFSNTATTRAACLKAKTTNTSAMLHCHTCVFDGFSTAIVGNYNVDWDFRTLFLHNCEIKNSTSHGIQNSGSTFLHGCYIHDNVGDGARLESGTNTTCVFDAFASIFKSNGGSGVSNQGGQGTQTTAYRFIRMMNCAVLNNTSDGITSTVGASTVGSAVVSYNTIYDSNGGYGVNTGGSNGFTSPAIGACNAFRSNTSGARNSFPTLPGDITLTADPFTNRASGDFSLNSTAGGGTACKGTGYPGVLSAGGTGHFDIGPLQSSGSGGGIAAYFSNPGMEGGLGG